jgi:DNA polymerase II large subunit
MITITEEEADALNHLGEVSVAVVMRELSALFGDAKAAEVVTVFGKLVRDIKEHDKAMAECTKSHRTPHAPR